MNDEVTMFLDGVCPKCGSFCGNGGHDPLRCECGWVDEECKLSEKAKRAIAELFDENLEG